MQDELPSLNPFIKIYPADNRYDGEPQWVIHCPSSNNFFKIGWKAFEIIGRLHNHDSISSLQESLIKDTGQEFTEQDIAEIATFIKLNGLDDANAHMQMEKPKDPWWKRAMHGYLYFTVPLMKPQKFLDQTYSYVSPLLHKSSVILSLVLLIVGVFMTLPRVDEFLNSFTSFFSMEGAAIIGVSFMLIKIIHELSHAYVATKYGVKVPHMGVAFIVLYPVLYTDATDAWRLRDKKERIHIGLAGVYVELILAALALIAWNYTAPGLIQMTLFSIVMISLVGSLLVNLNPLMRFDGYYVLSDWWGIENLHATAIDYARSHMRKILWGLESPASHNYPAATVWKLTVFGYAVMIYRFFLFLGIAVLVYHVFFPPLGLIAMIFELVWFIGMPVWKEMMAWWHRKDEIISQNRGRISLVLIACLIILSFIPLDGRVSAPAIVHADQYRALYPPETAFIEEVFVENDQNVKEGDVLMVLSSMDLDKDIVAHETDLRNLRQLKRRNQTDIDLFRDQSVSIDDEIETTRIALGNLYKKRENLTITSPFDGVVSKVDPEIHVGRSVNTDHLLLRVIAQTSSDIIHAYVPEADIDKIGLGDKASFRLNHTLFSEFQGTVKAISPLNVDYLPFPALASIYEGPIGVLPEKEDLIPISPIYSVKIALNSSEKQENQRMTSIVLPGRIILHGENQSFAHALVNQMINLYRENVNLN